MSTAFRDKQLIRRITDADIVTSAEPPQRTSSLGQIDTALRLAHEATQLLAQMRATLVEISGVDVSKAIEHLDASGRAVNLAMLALRAPTPQGARCEACSGTGRVSVAGGGICAPCKGSGMVSP